MPGLLASSDALSLGDAHNQHSFSTKQFRELKSIETKICAFLKYENKDKITKKACSQVPILFNKLSKRNISYKIEKIKKGNIWRKRTFADGIIDWRMSNIQINYLIL